MDFSKINKAIKDFQKLIITTITTISVICAAFFGVYNTYFDNEEVTVKDEVVLEVKDTLPETVIKEPEIIVKEEIIIKEQIIIKEEVKQKETTPIINTEDKELLKEKGKTLLKNRFLKDE